MTEDSTGALHAGTNGGTLLAIAPDGTATTFGTGSAPPPPGATEYGYFGLAAVSSGFIAVNYNSDLMPGLVSIDPTITNVTPFGTDFSTHNIDIQGSGALADGPDGVLYLQADAGGR